MKNSLLKILILSAVIVVFAASPAFAASAPIEVGVGYLNGGSFYLRSEPVLTASKLCVIPDGAVISVIDDQPIMDGNVPYIKVFYDGHIGYIRSDYPSIFTYVPHDLVVTYEGQDGSVFNCELGGVKKVSCLKCSYEGSEVISAGSHEIGVKGYTSLSCTEDSYSLEFCARCSWEGEKTIIVPAPGHDLSVGYTPLEGSSVNCENGYIKNTWCNNPRCDYELHEVFRSGHSYVEVARVDPTYHSSGTQTLQCDFCGHRDYITLPALVDRGMSDDFFFYWVKHF